MNQPRHDMDDRISWIMQLIKTLFHMFKKLEEWLNMLSKDIKNRLKSNFREEIYNI